MATTIENKPKGFLRRCIDRRFHAQTRQLFEQATGLGQTDYWDEGIAGGAAVETNEAGADYAQKNGATIWGWQAHGSHCGGQPGVSDAESAARLDKNIAKQRKTRGGRHFRIWVTDDSAEITEIK